MVHRERALLDAYARLADGIAADDEPGEVLAVLVERCVVAFDVDAAGLLLRGPDGRLALAASSSEEVAVLDFLQLEVGEGACLEAYESGEPVVVDDLDRARDRWPTWSARAVEAGFHAVTSVPLRLGPTAVGALSLFGRAPGCLEGDDLAALRTLSQLATTVVAQRRELVDARTLADQLQRALSSRVVIEQAKGVLAERHGISLQEAFELLRSQARREKRKVQDLAREVTAPEPLVGQG